ncbi:hypothetical protein GCM10010302_75060 [Streptomyces polychromogenes]|uniref:Uncharacterized protein n=1 Tax=Streptomyces polychromogenes TaxID=67342 RepID=A0ABN0W4I3_9ACTN
MARKETKDMQKYRQRLQVRADIEQDAHNVSGGFYTVTLDAPPHPHSVVGVAVGAPMPSAMEAVVSMQEYARGLGADGVLGMAICTDPQGSRGIGNDFGTPRFIAYGTAVRWASSE